MMYSTDHEKESLEAHVDLCAIRYQQLDSRLGKVESKIDTLGDDMKAGQHSLTKVIVGAVATVVASCLSIVVVLLMN